MAVPHTDSDCGRRDVAQNLDLLLSKRAENWSVAPVAFSRACFQVHVDRGPRK